MHQSAVRVSHALEALAPFHASDIARRLPFPHHRFFELSAQRIHLLGLSVVGLDILDIDITALAAGRWADVVKPLFDPVPIGLEGMLSKMALPMWSSDEYKRLWDLIGCPHALDYLLHAQALTARQVAILSALPPTLRHDTIVRHLHRPLEAKVLDYAFEDVKKADRLLRAAKQTTGRQGFLRKAHAIVCKTRKFTTAPEVRHADIHTVRTAAELRRVGLRFKNCLRSRADKGVPGQETYYVYDGPEPAVIMLSTKGPGSYVIEQMLGVANEALSNGTVQIIRKAFGRIGVGDWREAARRKTLDTCLSSLAWVTVDAAQEIDACCDTFFQRLKKVEALDEAPMRDWPW